MFSAEAQNNDMRLQADAPPSWTTIPALRFVVMTSIIALLGLSVIGTSTTAYQNSRGTNGGAPPGGGRPFHHSSSSSAYSSSSSIKPSSSPGLKRGYRNEGAPSEDAKESSSSTAPGFWQRPFSTMIVPSSSSPTSSNVTPSSLGILESILKENRRHLVSRTPIRTVEELRSAILDSQMSLSETKIENSIRSWIYLGSNNNNNTFNASPSTTTTETAAATATIDNPFQDHAVHTLMKERFLERSTPGHRIKGDNATLALAIEGGGMRGCVSAGMAAAVAALGLTDTIDSIYGSSAGSVVGAYLVSRQVCMDVYVDILPAAKKLFVCKKRMARSIATSLVEVLVRGMRRAPNFRHQLKHSPGMNISFVLDGIMGQEHGIRPLDMAKFEQNNAKQPLRVVSSCIDPSSGRLYSKTFGGDDFFHETSMSKADGSRWGLFACLEASMTVPGATGPPVNLMYPPSQPDAQNIEAAPNEVPTSSSSSKILPCFDAFCFEPIPYRSAVEEGATHVLVLCSRPEGYEMKTKPGIYESGVAPLYFHSHGHSKVAEFFEQGGQQYIYAEDLLTLEQAKMTALQDQHEDGVLIAPPEILYGVPRTPALEDRIHRREETWNRAHLFPIKVPFGQKELPTLEQDKDAVLQAVRGGFAAAFDALSSIVGMEHVDGKHAATLVFPDCQEIQVSGQEEQNPSSREEIILQTKLHVPGEPILQQCTTSTEKACPQWLQRPKQRQRSALPSSEGVDPSLALLMSLPGFEGGKFRHLAKDLRFGSGISDSISVHQSPIQNSQL